MYSGNKCLNLVYMIVSPFFKCKVLILMVWHFKRSRLYRWAIAIKSSVPNLLKWVKRRVGDPRSSRVVPHPDDISEDVDVKIERLDEDQEVRTFVPDVEGNQEEEPCVSNNSSSGSRYEEEEEDLYLYIYEEEALRTPVFLTLDNIAIGEETNPPFFRLISDCRKKIYEYISLKEVPNLRLICRFFKEDVDQLKGSRVTVNTSGQGILGLLANLGISYLSIKRLKEGSNLEGLIKYPHLLTSLSIAGPISLKNLNYLIESCDNIQRFSLELCTLTIRNSPPDANLDDDAEWEASPCSFQNLWSYPPSLKVFRLASTIIDPLDLSLVSDNFFPILERVHCPLTLNRFIYQGLFTMTPGNLSEFHSALIRFIQRHSKNLKTLQIIFKHLYDQEDMPSPSEGPHLNHQWSPLRLKDFRIKTDHHFLDKWWPLLKVQTVLKRLELNVKGLDWNLVTPLIQACSRSLKTLRIGALSFTADPRRVSESLIEVDLFVLAECTHLESLSLIHQDNPRLVNVQITNFELLPTSLTRISFSRFRISPRSVLSLLGSLPNLKRIELIFWTFDDTLFESLLRHLPIFLRSHPKSPLKQIALFDHQSRFQRHRGSLNKFKAEMTLYRKNHVGFKETLIQQAYTEFEMEFSP